MTDAIVEGSEDLPVAVVQWPRHRLVSARHRLGLARSLEELAREAAAPSAERVRLVLPLLEPWRSSHRLPTSCWRLVACCEPGGCRSAASPAWSAS